jgi:O-antigen/teichoic acid export membrane protein
VLSQVVLVASGVIVARALGPHGRGLLALLALLPQLVGQVANLGMPLAITRAVASSQASPTAMMRQLRPWVALQLVFACVAHAVLLWLLLLPRASGGFAVVGLISLVLGASSLAQTYGLSLLQGESRFTAFNVLRIAPAVLYVFLIVALAAVGRATLTPIAIAWIIANVVVAAVTSAVAIGRPSRAGRAPSSEPPPVRSLLGFGVRAMFGATSPIADYRLDQLLVGAVLSPGALGLYVVATAFTNLTRFLGQSIGMVAYPDAAAQSDPSARLRKARAYFGIGAVICAAVTVVLVLAMPWLLPAFFGRKFGGAVMPARLLLIAGLFAAVRRILVDTTRGAGHPMWGTVAELSTLTALPLAVVALQLGMGLTAISAALVLGNGLGLVILLPSLLAHRPPLRLKGRIDFGMDSAS